MTEHFGAIYEIEAAVRTCVSPLSTCLMMRSAQDVISLTVLPDTALRFTIFCTLLTFCSFLKRLRPEYDLAAAIWLMIVLTRVL